MKRIQRRLGAVAVAVALGFGPASTAFAQPPAQPADIAPATTATASATTMVAGGTITATPAFYGPSLARAGSGGSSGGGRGGGGGFGHSSGGGTSVGRNPSAPRNSSAKVPTTSGKVKTGAGTGTKPQTNNNVGTGTKAKPNTGTGTKAKRNANTPRNSTMKVPVTSGKVTASKVTIPRGTRINSTRANIGGYTYVDNRAMYTQFSGYYTRYPSHYPPCCSRAYYVAINSPFYYPNYLPGGVWYQQPYPVGMVVQNNFWVPAGGYTSPGPSPGKILLVIFLIIVLVLAAIVAVIAGRKIYENRRFSGGM
jgi:hypothetical protein